MDGFSKFKRDIFRFDGSDDRKLLSLKIYFRFRREKAFSSYRENQLTDFRNSNGICSGLIEMMTKIVVAENLLPVSTGKYFCSYLEN